MCAMEMVAWLAGEEHSDEPRCACPVIAAFVRAVNDALPSDGERGRLLRPLIPQLVGTRGNRAAERRRGLQAVDAMVRRLLPLRLLRGGDRVAAELLMALPPVTGRTSAAVALRAVQCHAPDQRAARWVLERAVEGMAPARFVAGIVQLARDIGGRAPFVVCAEAVVRMAGRRSPARVGAP